VAADGVQTVGFGERKLARTFPCTLLEVADVQWFAGRAREHERIGRAPREGREMCAKDGCFVGGQVGAPAAKVAIGPLCFRSSALAAFTGVGPRPPGDARVPRTESLGFVLASKRDRVEVGERRRRHCRCPGPQRLGHRPQHWRRGPSPVAGCPSPRRCPVHEQPCPHRHLTCSHRSGGGGCAIYGPPLVVEHPCASREPNSLQTPDELIRVAGSVETLAILALAAGQKFRPPTNFVAINGPTLSVRRDELASPATQHRHSRRVQRHGAPRDPIPLYRGAKWQGAATSKSGNRVATREAGPRIPCSGRLCGRPEEGSACPLLGGS